MGSIFLYCLLLDSSSDLLLYSITSLASHITTILIIDIYSQTYIFILAAHRPERNEETGVHGAASQHLHRARPRWREDLPPPESVHVLQRIRGFPMEVLRQQRRHRSRRTADETTSLPPGIPPSVCMGQRSVYAGRNH